MEKQGLPFDSRALDSRLQGLQALPTSKTITVLPVAKNESSHLHAARRWVLGALHGGQVALRWPRWA